MTKFLLAAAAATAVAFAAAPGFAGDFYTPNGFVGADYSYDHFTASGGGGHLNVNSYGVSGSTEMKLNSALNLEVDADYAHSDGNGFSLNTGGADAHVFLRSDKGAFGLVGGGHAVGSYATVGDFGAEGARFFDKFTVLADWKTNWTDTSPRFHLTTIDLAGRYYINDNFRLDARAAYDRPSVLGNYSNGWDVGVGSEYRFAKLPVSAYATVDYTDFGSKFGLKDTAVRVGLRWNFDGSLKSRERTGATFAPTGNSSVSGLFGAL